MNTDLVHKEFTSLISKRGIYKKLGTTSGHVRNLRHKIKNGVPVSTDLKLLLLQKSGWRQADKIYDRHDLVSLARSVILSGTAAKELGPEYLVQKWEISKS